jgi:hypothetical protein
MGEQCCGKCENYDEGECTSDDCAWCGLKRAAWEGVFCPDFQPKPEGEGS